MQICTTMGLEVPIPVSMKLGDNNNLFRSIIEAAQRPHLSIPETELGKSTKQHRHLIQRSLGYAVGMLF
jgi:Ras family protein T1